MKPRLYLGRYRHYEGDYYRTHGLGVIEETGEACVIYYRDDDVVYSRDDGFSSVKTLLVRTLENWNGTVNGEPRFKLVD